MIDIHIVVRLGILYSWHFSFLIFSMMTAFDYSIRTFVSFSLIGQILNSTVTTRSSTRTLYWSFVVLMNVFFTWFIVIFNHVNIFCIITSTSDLDGLKFLFHACSILRDIVSRSILDETGMIGFEISNNIVLSFNILSHLKYW